VTVFAAIDHSPPDFVGTPHRQERRRFEPRWSRPAIAAGLQLHHDHGSVYVSDDFQNEISFRGMESSPAIVRQPEGNGCIEPLRFAPLKSSFCGSDASAISRNTGHSGRSSEIVTTIMGFCIA
jgi:transposase InsO family protein